MLLGGMAEIDALPPRDPLAPPQVEGGGEGKGPEKGVVGEGRPPLVSDAALGAPPRLNGLSAAALEPVPFWTQSFL